MDICIAFGGDVCNAVVNSECIDGGANSRTCQCMAGYYGPSPVTVADSSPALGFTGSCVGMC